MKGIGQRDEAVEAEVAKVIASIIATMGRYGVDRKRVDVLIREALDAGFVRDADGRRLDRSTEDDSATRLAAARRVWRAAQAALTAAQRGPRREPNPIRMVGRVQRERWEA